MRYSAQDLLNYISGADMSEEVLEQLENNEEFMIAVLNHTKDSSMFRYVSDSLKGNARFIRRIIEIFENNIEFVVSILNEFENKNNVLEQWNCMSDEQIAYDELLVVVSKIYDKTKDDRLMMYKMYGSHLTYAFETWVTLVMHDDQEFIEENFDSKDHLSYEIFLEVYQDSPILLDYHFKHLIDSLSCIEGLNLEETLHAFYKVEDPSNISSNEMALKLIGHNDSSFANYLRYNPKYMNELIKEIDVIKKRWSNYIFSITRNKINNIINIWEKNHEKYINSGIYPSMYYFSLLIKELGFHSIFSKYAEEGDYIPFDDISKDEKDSLLDFWADYRANQGDKTADIFARMEEEERRENMIDNPLMERLKKVMIKVFSNDLPYEKQNVKVELGESTMIFSENEPVVGSDNRIINVDFKNKKIINVIRNKRNGNGGEPSTTPPGFIL